jgi:hypothetical protein
MGFEEILAVLQRWLGLEIEVSTHGANGAAPVTALEARGRLRSGDELRAESAAPGSLVFVITDDGGTQVAAFRLHEDSYAGGGWFDDAEEVIEVRSGVIQLLIAPVEHHADAGSSTQP